jgi:hypothetical protein
MTRTVCLNVCGLLVVSGLLAAAPAWADLAALSLLRDASAGRASSYDVTGGNGDSWDFNSGQTREIAYVRGPGAITHLWFTIASREPGNLRKIVLRFYWDGEPSPSIECPIGDFFGLGHGQYYLYGCAPIQIGDRGGLNCYWRMPFQRSARITVTNECASPIGLYFHVDHERFPASLVNFDEVGYFHAEYRQGRPPDPRADYTILEATGRGAYVGCNYTIQLGSPDWWGEGDDKCYIDGAQEPTIWGTGSEDYFNGAWGFPNTAYANLYTGVPLNGFFETGAITNCYRYHIEDPIPFKKSIRLDMEHRAGDYIASVAYWYQREPHAPFAPLPSVFDRLVEDQRSVYLESGAYDVEDYQGFFRVEGAPADALVIDKTSGYQGRFSGNAQLVLKASAAGAKLVLPKGGVPGVSAVTLWLTRGPQYATLRVRYGNDVLLDSYDRYAPEVTRGEALKIALPRPTGADDLVVEVIGKNEASTGYWIGLDCVKTD